MDSARITMIAGAAGRHGPGCPAFLDVRTLPPSPPTDRADDATVSSSDLSEDLATTVSGETAPSDASSAPTSPQPDTDLTKGTREIQGPKNIQEVGIEGIPHGEGILHDVAHTLGGGGPSSMSGGYPTELDFGAAHPLSKSVLSAKLGWDGGIPRWQPKQRLKYVVCKNTFPKTSEGAHAAEQLAKAIRMWGDVGVTFEEAQGGAAANFRVVYSPQKHPLAMGFFPNDGPPEARTLWIYAQAFEPRHVNNQANILAHEIGHILGLRHECAMETEQDYPSTMWGKDSPESVMQKSHFDSSMWHVQQQDRDEVKSFYETSQTTHNGMVIRNYTAPSAVYPRLERMVARRFSWPSGTS
ncbi:hypothetical protein MAPG_05260 [Magnaporthiopsis poae ATCC 64411]|uniref:Peptidase metallopeptidase domain-containing protein n=1 Tax=Magnaporthiopsis poae (strain ATCC 64411 / 73-15) TaxID=644358 RepID=A0A0C4DYX5_MAGP6|nr:hypothetical protein MAPG_05260 [Magnaporthiopsis poae ATCC 64411]